MPKKTIKILDLLEFANAMLRDSNEDQVQARYGAGQLLERALMATDTYAGFQYLPGMMDVDNSRRRYLVHRNLVRDADAAADARRANGEG
jgi:hypothetical protein